MWQREITNNRQVQIVPFHWAHPYAMDLREFDKRAFDNIPNYQDMLKAFQAEGGAVTALWRGKIIACLGCNNMWPGVSEAWMITSIEFPNISVTVTRAAIRYFNKIAIEHKLKRLQITVDVENELAMRWAKMLKFTPEGVMRKYGAGGIDHMMFARIYE
jgi:hypothetical protein